MKKEGKIIDPSIIKKVEKNEKNLKVVSIGIILIFISVFAFVSFTAYAYTKSPERNLDLGAEIERVLISEDGKFAFVKLKGGSNDKNVVGIKFVLTDANGREYVYETNAGIENISVPYETTWLSWLGVGPNFEGVFDFNLSAEDFGLPDFNQPLTFEPIFIYEDEPLDY